MDNEKTTVLLIEDNPGDARLIQEFLSEAGSDIFRLEHVDRLSLGLERLARGDIGVILLDLSLPDSQGLEGLLKILTKAPDVPVVVLSSIKDEAVAKAHQGLLPTDANGRFPSQIRGGTWNILNGTQHPQESYEFLKHITSKDGCVGFNLVAGQGAFVRPDVLQELVAKDSVHEWFIPNLENGIPAHAPANSRGKEYTDACVQWATILFDPKAPIAFEKGLQDLHDNIQKVLDQEAA